MNEPLLEINKTNDFTKLLFAEAKIKELQRIIKDYAFKIGQFKSIEDELKYLQKSHEKLKKKFEEKCKNYNELHLRFNKLYKETKYENRNKS